MWVARRRFPREGAFAPRILAVDFCLWPCAQRTRPLDTEPDPFVHEGAQPFVVAQLLLNGGEVRLAYEGRSALALVALAELVIRSVECGDVRPHCGPEARLVRIWLTVGSRAGLR